MICSSCRASDVPDDASSCPRCGAALIAVKPTAGGRPAPMPPPGDRGRNERLRDLRLLGLLLLGVTVGMIVIAFLIYWEHT
jgi:hypothetical protein